MQPISGKERRSQVLGLPPVGQRARFQAVCVAWSWFRQRGVLSSHPKRVTRALGRLKMIDLLKEVLLWL
jgi:hypothetical protein